MKESYSLSHSNPLGLRPHRAPQALRTFTLAPSCFPLQRYGNQLQMPRLQGISMEIWLTNAEETPQEIYMTNNAFEKTIFSLTENLFLLFELIFLIEFYRTFCL